MSLRFKKLIEKAQADLSGAQQELIGRFLLNDAAPKARSAVEDFLPIEAFRWGDVRVENPHTYFLSSGTTAATRSKSEFSKEGLELYRLASLHSFDEVMSRVLGESWWEHKGISLIPSTLEWQHSSLAQMIGWISECARLEYGSVESLDSILPKGEPVWIFGTGWHFVEWMRQGHRLKLHPNSVVLETGGTKGLATEIPREEYLQQLAESFGLADSQIISEYGMCELASQAYELGTSERKFYFPNWVSVSVETPEGIKASGDGCLIIEDPLRSDLKQAIRVQDYVQLDDDGGFKFLGRLVGAPLKGCSLKAKDLLDARVEPSRQVHVERPQFVPKIAEKTRLEAFAKALKKYLTDPKTLNALDSEIGGEKDATWVIEQSLSALPANAQEWQKMLATAGAGTLMPKHWLFIAPQSHSLAMLYPLCAAHLLGLDVSLRFPRPLAERAFLKSILEFLASEAFHLRHALDYTYRIQSDADLPQDVGALFCFASDETLAQLHERLTIPIQGFGSHVAVGMARVDDAIEHAELLVRDAFSLAQQGCSSMRALIVAAGASEATQLARLASKLHAAADAFLTEASSRLRLAHKHEALRYEKKLNAICTGSKSILVAQCSGADDFSAKLSSAPRVLPLIVVNDAPEWQKSLRDLWRRERPEIRTIYLQKPLADKGFCNKAFGTAQILPWDGSHEARALFILDHTIKKKD